MQGAVAELGGKQKGADYIGWGLEGTEKEFEGAVKRFAGTEGEAEGPKASGSSPSVSWEVRWVGQPLPLATCSVSPLAPGLISKFQNKKLNNSVLKVFFYL